MALFNLVSLFFLVLVPPKIRAGQLSFGAAKGSHVDLQCEVEASPKPMTSWIRKDQMLFASKKYKIEEIVNFYNVTMKLRINDLEEKDFAAYKCVAKNTLGEREGRLRVYGEFTVISRLIESKLIAILSSINSKKIQKKIRKEQSISSISIFLV